VTTKSRRIKPGEHVTRLEKANSLKIWSIRREEIIRES